MQGRIAGGKDTTLANPQKRNLIVPCFLTYPIDGGVDIVVHVVVDREPALGSSWLTPIDQPEIQPLGKQTSY